MVEKPFGKGKAILIGSFVALSYQRDHAESTKDFLVALARAAGVQPDAKVSGSGTAEIEVRRFVGDHDQFIFAFNHAATPAEAQISVDISWPVREVRDLQRDAVVPYRETGGRLTLRRKLAGGEIWVLRAERR